MNLRQAAFLFVAFFIVAITLALTPIHLTVLHSMKSVPVIKVDGASIFPVSYSEPALNEVTIVHAGRAGDVIEFALPVDADGRRLKVADLQSVSEGWIQTYDGERIESRVPGSAVTISLETKVLEIPFLGRTDGGMARVSSDLYSMDVDLRAERYSWRPTSLPSENQKSVAFLGSFYSFHAVDLSFSGVTRPPKAAAKLTLGGGPLLTVVDAGVSASTIEIGVTEKLGLLATQGGNLLLLVGTMTLLYISLSAIGCLILMQWPGNRFGGLVQFVTGLASVALMANALAYFFPVRSVALALALCVAAGVLVGLWRNAAGLTSVRWARTDGGAVLASVASVWFSFWPAAFVGPIFLGFLQTDSFFYPNVSDALLNNSMFELMEQGSIIGYGMRSLDLVFAGVLAALGLPMHQVWVALCCLFMALPPLATYRLIHMWFGHRRAAVVGAWVVALSAPLASLFFQAYLVQYLFTCLLYLNLLTAALCWQTMPQGLTWNSTFPFAVSVAALLLLYPYFAVLPFTASLLLLGRAIHLRVARRLLYFGGLALLACNVGLLAFLNHKATIEFAAPLNILAQNVVFPFFFSPKFVNFMLGVVPFHGDAAFFSGLAAEFGGALSWRLVSGYLEVMESGGWRIPLVLAAVVVVAMVAVGRAWRGFAVVVPLAFVLYVLLITMSFVFSGLYSAAKLSWTVGALFPLLVACVVGGICQSRSAILNRGYIRVAAALLLGSYMLGTFVSKMAAPVLWLANPYGAVAAQANTAVAAELIKLHQVLRPVSSGDAVIAMGASSVALSQPQQVFGAHAMSLLSSSGYSCVNCVSSIKLLDFRTVDGADVSGPVMAVKVLDGQVCEVANRILPCAR